MLRCLLFLVALTVNLQVDQNNSSELDMVAWGHSCLGQLPTLLLTNDYRNQNHEHSPSPRPTPSRLSCKGTYDALGSNSMESPRVEESDTVYLEKVGIT